MSLSKKVVATPFREMMGKEVEIRGINDRRIHGKIIRTQGMTTYVQPEGNNLSIPESKVFAVTAGAFFLIGSVLFIMSSLTSK